MTKWLRKRLKYCVQLVNEKVDGEIPSADYIGLENIEPETGRLIDSNEPMEIEGTANRFRSGDVLFSKLRPYLAKCLTLDRAGFCTSELLVLRPRLVNRRFLLYSLLNPQFIRQVNGSTYGSKMPRASWEFIGNLSQAVPPLEEQHAIAEFLDRKTAQIDGVIAKKQRMIDLLHEKRQALISEAVTKGLDPDVPTKDSGIEWLGRVPRHWELVPLGYLVAVQGGSTPNKETLAFWDGDIPWVSPKDMKRWVIADAEDHVTQKAITETSLSLITPPAVLLVVRGMILVHSVPVALASAPVTINQDMKALRPNRRCSAAYLSHLLRAVEPALLAITEESGHGTRCLRTELWQKIRIPLPPVQEQVTISAYIEEQAGRIFDVIKLVESQIAKLREYRQTLISAAVTGKIDVTTEGQR